LRIADSLISLLTIKSCPIVETSPKILPRSTNIAMDRDFAAARSTSLISHRRTQEIAMNALRTLTWSLAFVMAVAAGPLRTIAADESAYYKACYLQSDQRDFAAAATLFEQTAGDSAVPAEIRKAATQRLAECREELAAADLAALMPAESIAYVQFANIGSQVKTLLQSLGLAGDGEANGNAGQRIPLEEGLSFPVDFALSPALVREISKLGGVAASLTGFGAHGMPQGVVVIHVGDSDLVSGLVETGMQVVTPNESIEGYTTYRIPADRDVELWMAQTERLLVLSPSREQIAAVVGRLRGQGAAGESLKDAASFRTVADAREDSLLFAWADSQRAAPLVYAAMAQEMNPQEMMAVSAVLNLPQIECATFALGATEGGARAEAALRFKPGHQHLVYSLLRTAPIGVDALRHVPGDAAVVAAIGLNPPTTGGAKSDASAAPPQIALMDLGREFFANVRSATVFAASGSAPVPEFGVVVFAQDAGKSRELWTQLLGLPARLGFAPPEASGDVDIAGRKATRYAYPGAPPIFVSQASEDALVIGTAGAVETSLAAADAGDAKGATKLLAHANSSTSKAVFLQFGSLARFAARHAHGQEAGHMAAVAPLLDDTTASLTIDEDPNELRVRLEVADVPHVADVLRTVGETAGHARNLQATADH
jgi:hypothetical protein